jgi:tRNA threonylcarbamoyladenosine biosynthesis protein TsaE
MQQKQLHVTTRSLSETQDLAKRIGRLATEGTVIALIGHLGSGKTAFVQGLAQGLEVPSNYYITSPTFTLINEYPGRCRLFHVDLYRINSVFEAEEIGLFEILEGSGVTAIEWAERVADALPVDHLRIQFEILENESRKISILAYGSKTNILLREIKNWIEEKK